MKKYTSTIVVFKLFMKLYEDDVEEEGRKKMMREEEKKIWVFCLDVIPFLFPFIYF